MTIGFKGFNIVMQEEEYIDLKNRIVEEKLK
jgi:hypothetical protein